MKRFFILTLSIILFTGTAFVSGEKVQSTKLDPAVYKLMEVVSLWDLLKGEYDPYLGEGDTWLEEGFRAKYAMAKKYASLTTIETVFDTPVFVRGPHDGEMNFNSTTSFGYYNHEFIYRLKTSVEVVLKNPTFKKAAKQVYTRHLKSMALTYQDAYRYLNGDASRLQALKTNYLAQLAQPEGTLRGALHEEFRDYADNGYFSDNAERRAYKTKNPNEDWYEKVSAPAFWLRRSIDGTSQEIFELLNMVILEMEK